MAKRELVMLAHPLSDHDVGGFYVSEKLDGMRAWWDGGVSRGIPVSEVPYANTAKDGRYLDQDIRATGLWSRYGKVIHAPDWWLDQLPSIPLDGELWMGPQSFQRLRSTVSTLLPGDDWRYVIYKVFDIPDVELLLGPGKIDNVNFKKIFTADQFDWYKKKGGKASPIPLNFQENYRKLCKLLAGKVAIPHKQIELPASDFESVLDDMLHAVSSAGGEGLIARNPFSIWVPERTHNMVKIKKLLDAEGIVVGYTTGRETDKGSRHLGRMGALIIRFNNQEFELSGFTDNEREFEGHDARDWATKNPHSKAPDWIKNPLFPRGTVVTFQYRDLTDKGIPKEARYWRK